MPKNGRSNSSTLSSKAPEFGCTIESVHGPVGDADAATVEVKFGEAPIVLVKFDSTGKRIKDAEVDAALQNSVCQQLLDGVEILRTGPHEDGFAVWTNPFSSSTDLGSVGLTLIDKSGNEQRPFGSSGNGTENIRSFKVAPADVEAIAIRLRPYTHVATFENVSLKPGKQTDVKVSIEAIGQQPLVQADANNDEKKPIDNVSTKLHGMISDVDAARNLVEISLGADDGVVAGQVLEVYELLPGSNKPSPESKGKIRVTNDIDHDFATAQINHLQPNAVLQRGDYVIGIKAAVAAIKPAEQAVVVQAGKDEEPGVVTAKPIAATAGGPDFILPDHLNVMAVGFAADSKTLVSVSWDKAPDLDATRFATRFVIRTWDVAEKRLTREVELEWDQNWNRNSASMMLSHDRTKVISILEGKQVGIWDAASGRLINRLKPPIELQEELLGTLTCTSDLSKIACGKNAPYADTLEAADAHVIVWNANTGLVLQTLTLKTGFRVQSLAFSADGTRLATVGSQKGADVWEVSSGKRLLEFRNRNFDRKHPDRPDREKVYDIVTSAGLSPDGKLLAVSDILGVKLIDVTSGKVLRQIDAPYRYRAKSPGFVFSDDGRLFSLLGGFTQENVLPIWSMETGEMIMSLPTEAYDGSFSDDGQWFAVGLSDAKEAVAVWQTGPAKLPVGQEFLKEYPKLHGLSLDMTEKQFLEIAEQQDLKPQRTPDVDHPRYEISTGDGHTLIVMFGNNGEKCSGIQRIRGDLAAVPPPVPPE